MTAANAKRDRTYGQFCPIAAGLDVVGDRWVLLICRELAFGDQRFTDLRSALRGIAPNLLSERLRMLTDAGLVTTAELPPPAARTVYRLTPAGRRVIPVLRAVARFGAPYLEGEPGADLDARRAASALLVPWWRPTAGGPASMRVRLVLAGEGAEGGGADVPDADAADAADLVADGRTMRVVAPDLAQRPDVVVTTTVADLAAARKEGGALVADVAGSAAARRAFLVAFDLAAPET